MLSRYGNIKCLFFRLRISHALDGNRPLPPRVGAHLLGCPDCLRFHSVSALLPYSLRTDPAGLETGRGAVLAGRAMAHPESPRARGFVPRSAKWNPRRAVVLATGLAVMLLAALLVLDHDGARIIRADDAAASEEGLFKQGLKLLNVHLSRIGKTTLGVHVVEPLKAEVERLAADAESVQSYFLAIINQGAIPSRSNITTR